MPKRLLGTPSAGVTVFALARPRLFRAPLVARSASPSARAAVRTRQQPSIRSEVDDFADFPHVRGVRTIELSGLAQTALRKPHVAPSAGVTVFAPTLSRALTKSMPKYTLRTPPRGPVRSPKLGLHISWGVVWIDIQISQDTLGNNENP